MLLDWTPSCKEVRGCTQGSWGLYTRKLEVVHKEVGGCTQGSWRLSQRKQRSNMCTAKENSAEILKWLLICSQDLRGFVKKVR